MINKIRLLFGLAAMLLSVGTLAQPKIEQAAKKAVADTLKDPNSALFRGIKTYTASDKSRHVCGEVNAKNSFGGYVGFGAFVAIYAADQIVIVNTEPAIAIHMCSPARIEASIQAEMAKKKEEVGALCPEGSTESTPGTCGELMAKCKTRLRFLADYSERTDFMRHCRIKGFESASDFYGTPDPIKVK